MWKIGASGHVENKEHLVKWKIGASGQMEIGASGQVENKSIWSSGK